MKCLWKVDQSAFYQADTFQFLGGIPSNSVEAVITDPPYLLSNNGSTCVGGQRASVNKGDWDTSKGVEADHLFHLAWLGECYRILQPGGVIWVTGTHHCFFSFGFAANRVGFQIINTITWEKPNPPPNLGCRCFTHSTELLLFAAKPSKNGKKYTFNYQEMKEENGGKQMKSVWQFYPPKGWEVKHGKHPAQKPIALITRILKASTNPGDRVVDPFAGSSTTGIAAIKLGRVYLGCDSNEEAIKLSLKRLNDL